MSFLPLLLALLQSANAAGEPASYEALVERGVTEARLGRTAAAEEALAQAIARDPDRPEAYVERGGLRFLEKSYGDAARDLERALALGEDPYARDLLAASLHLLGRTDDALASWNRNGGPRLGRTEITGLRYTKDPVARRELTLREGEPLLLDDLRESRRRLEETQVFERVTFRPEPRGDGTADLEVALLERHGFASTTTELLAGTAAQLADRRISLRYANIGGRGASVGASWRFAEGRPEVTLGFDWARPLGLDANLHVVARRGRQGYLFEEEVERESRGLDVGFRRVLGARTTAELGFGFRNREFSDETPSAVPGSVAGPQLGLERRLVEGGGHRLDASVRVFGALPALGSDLSFARGGVALRYERSRRGDPERESFAARVLFAAGTDGLPLDEGFAPGAGPESPFPLRAHRQFEDGVAGTTPLSRSLLLANFEWRRTLVSRGSIRLGAVVFYDTARTSRGLLPPRSYHDVGLGVRIGLGGAMVRIDWGHGLVDGASALTLGLGHAF